MRFDGGREHRGALCTGAVKRILCHRKGIAEKVFTNGYAREYDPIEYTKLDDIEKAYNSLVKRYGKILLGGIDDDDVKVEKNVTVKLELLEKEFKGCKVYTYTPDKERIAAALKAFSEEMREDEELLTMYVH